MRLAILSGGRDHVRLSMKKTISAVVLMLGLSGCGPKYGDSSNLRLTPGLGIAGVVEIGMTPEQVGRATHDLVTSTFEHIPGEVEYEVPSLGISWQSGRSVTNNPIRVFTVYVGPSSANEQQPRPHSRFGGMLAGVLSLRSEGWVSRDQIVGLLGEPVEHYDLSTMQEQDRVQRISALIAELRTNVLSSAIRWPSSGERLAYPQRGIYLELVSNTVWEIGIAKPGEQGAAPLPRAPQPGHSEGAR